MDYIELRLAKLARSGDRDAFEQLVNLYKDKIFHLGYRMLNDKHEAEDIVQETFLRVYKNLDKFDEAHKFSTWIYRIATNLCIDRLRKRKAGYSLDAETRDGEGLEWHDKLATEHPGPESEVLLTETQEHIRRAINTLPDKYKSIVILRYLHDLSLQEISDIVEMPVTTIKTRIHRGREHLRRKLAKDQLL